MQPTHVNTEFNFPCMVSDKIQGYAIFLFIKSVMWAQDFLFEKYHKTLDM